VLSALVGRRGTTSRTLNSEELFWVEVSFHTRDMMRFRRCQRYGQYRGDLLGSFALAHELHQLAPPRRQLSNVGRDGSNAMPLVTVHNQIGHSWAEPSLPPLQCLHCRHQILGSVGFEYPPANPRFQAVSYDLLGVHGGQDQDYLVQDGVSESGGPRLAPSVLECRCPKMPALLYRIPSVGRTLRRPPNLHESEGAITNRNGISNDRQPPKCETCS
jgi:hypothetical protein